MTAEITTVVGQLNIVGGTWRGDAPNQVAVREPKSAGAPGAGKGDLFVLTELQGPATNRQALEQQLAATIRDSYYLARGSITTSLRRALQAAGDLLYKRNYKANPDERVIGGAVAVVMAGEDAFVAQIGPTAFFAVLGDYLRRYPTQSAWLDEALNPAQVEEEAMLGLNRVVEPNLHHVRVGPEDRLVLAGSRLASQLPLELVVKAVEGHNVKTAVKNLGKAAQTRDGSALILAVIEQRPSTFGPLKVSTPSPLGRLFSGQSHPPDAARSSTSPTSAPEPELVAEPEPAPARPGPTPRSESRSGRQPARPKSTGRPGPTARKQPAESQGQANRGPRSYVAGYQPSPATKTPAPSPQTRTSPAKGYDLEQRLEPEARTLASIAPGPAFNRELPQGKGGGRASPLGLILRWMGTSLLMLIILLGNGLKAIFNLVLPGVNSQAPRQAGMQARHSPPSPAAWVMLRNVAIAIPLLVALIVGISYLQKGRLREAEYRQLVDTAQNKFEQAQAVDHKSALGLIAEGENLLTEAEKIKPDQSEISDLRLKMAEATDRLGNVQRLYYLPQLRQYTDSGTNLKSIIVQGVELYVLDGGQNRIYHHRLDDLGETLQADDDTLLLAAQGQVVDDVTIGQLLGMAWMPTGGNRQTSDLLILSSSGLLEYNPNWGVTTSALAGSESLVSPVAVSSFFGNFYILEPATNKLLRYLPTTDGYSAAPESYFSSELSIDLSRAVDFAIDGAIYVLFKDGHVSKYLSGQPANDFNLNGLDVPFNNPVSIFTAPDEEVQHIYVADAGNQRIVQLNKDGSFVRQFKPRVGEAVSFANLQDIFVDEIGGRLYILDSNNLYLANMPNE